ncbi:acyl-CoA synthetase [Mesorhizobium sp. LNHC229A00]|uniref:acyl-CoA synthetase n=1 Tax=Mesorhizobium sp. LNHC229A00 TaxID=1287240 RepID=UPI0003CF3831|nr:acyl-CoA synthetase [Mesorhizobium sp. LNHC229A00]ESY89577.1 AMP-binding protein [Mesorhizobium sp. LNHC229A00]
MTKTQAGLPRYDDAVASFRIEDEITRLQGDPATGINAYVECCGRHTGRNRLALRAISADGELSEFSFEDLADMSGRVGTLLKELGVGPGDVVAGMLPRIPELLALILGTWRIGAVYQPLFTAFGPKAIEHRLGYSGAKLVATNPANRGKLDEVANPPRIAIILGAGDALPPGDIDFRVALAAASPNRAPVMCKGEDLFMMMSTSGTTGLPKGVPVPLNALLAFGAYMRDAIGLRPNDIFWNIADPGWAYGLYYAITGPLLLGIATTFNEGAFTAKNTYDVIERLGVTSLAGSPTAFRLLLAEGPDPAARAKGRLRVVSSAGEPLNPEVIRWFDAHLAAPIHDHYGQTENGMMVNNHHGLAHPFRAGSAGFAMPGYRMVVLDEAGNELGPNQPGILAVDIANSPLRWFDGYHQAETPAISGGYYRTGDTVEYEPDGSVSFIGRADDVITSSGYRIGPFDVESALIEHPAVNEAAVVGVPDPQRTEIVKAFVILAPAYEGSTELAEELARHVRERLSAHAYPREIDFVGELPKTPSGKIQRFLLRMAEVEKRKG